jgi:flagellar L-ring protein precursor FlgH
MGLQQPGEELKAVGKAPKLSPTGETYASEIEPSLGDSASARRAAEGSSQPQAPASSASLFRTGSSALFQDQRAARLGDILTIRINIQDKATVDNSTTRSRSGGESAGLGALLGLENPLKSILPGSNDTSKLVDAKSTSTSNGAGNTSRSAFRPRVFTKNVASVTTCPSRETWLDNFAKSITCSIFSPAAYHSNSTSSANGRAV